MTPMQAIEVLDWDSEFFDCRIGRVNAESLALEQLEEILAQAQCLKINCLYYLDNTNNSKLSSEFIARGALAVSRRVRLKHTLGQVTRSYCNACEIRQYKIEYLQAIRRITADCYHQSRFYQDEHFSVEHCRKLYDHWVVKDCNDDQTQVFVAIDHQKVAGYITCKLGDFRTGQISLLGVSPVCRGKQIGRSLIHHALDWFAKNHCQEVNVITQEDNVAAMRVYQACGFVCHQTGQWYHFWPKNL